MIHVKCCDLRKTRQEMRQKTLSFYASIIVIKQKYVLKQIEFFIVVKNEVKKEIGLLEVNKTVQYTGIPRKIIKETLNLVSDFIVQI